MRRRLGSVFGCIGAPVLIIGLLILGVYLYTAASLQSAKNFGIYASPGEGYRQILERNFTNIIDITDIQAGPNWKDGRYPHVWFVSARVRALNFVDGTPVKGGETHPGSYFLRVKEGWVLMPESRFPELIGRWMLLFRLS